MDDNKNRCDLSAPVPSEVDVLRARVAELEAEVALLREPFARGERDYEERARYQHVEGTDCFVSIAKMPDHPVDTEEKAQAVIDYVDTICPDSDDAYTWDSKVMRERHRTYVRLMYLAHDGLERMLRRLRDVRRSGSDPTE